MAQTMAVSPGITFTWNQRRYPIPLWISARRRLQVLLMGSPCMSSSFGQRAGAQCFAPRLNSPPPWRGESTPKALGAFVVLNPLTRTDSPHRSMVTQSDARTFRHYVQVGRKVGAVAVTLHLVLHNLTKKVAISQRTKKIAQEPNCGRPMSRFFGGADESVVGDVISLAVAV